MTKKLLILTTVVTTAMASHAAGIVTNMNQSSRFLGNQALGTTLTADAAFFNPAGTAFMDNGFHLMVGNQVAYQIRQDDVTFAPFVYNGGEATKNFKATTVAPLMPNIDLVWTHNRWAVMGSFAVSGGGGSAYYKTGPGIFERPISAMSSQYIPMINQMGGQFGIDLNAGYAASMRFDTYQASFSTQLGASYRITDWLSAAVGVRMTNVSQSYKGGLGDDVVVNGIHITTSQGELGQVLGSLVQVNPALAEQVGQLQPMYEAMTQQEVRLNSKLKGTGFAPMVAIYFQKDSWAASARYEFRTALTLEADTKVNTTGDPSFNDGAKLDYDQPALLQLALSREFNNKVKVTGEYHHFFDTDANISSLGRGVENYSLGKHINSGTNEYSLGVDWKVSDKVKLSTGYTFTDFNLDDNYQWESEYQLDNHMVGIGIEYQINPKVSINASYAHCFYTSKNVTRTDEISSLNFDTKYMRDANLWGVGVNFKF